MRYDEFYLDLSPLIDFFNTLQLLLLYLLVRFNQFRRSTPKAGSDCIEFHLFDALITTAVKVVRAKESNIDVLEMERTRNIGLSSCSTTH